MKKRVKNISQKQNPRLTCTLRMLLGVFFGFWVLGGFFYLFFFCFWFYRSFNFIKEHVMMLMIQKKKVNGCGFSSGRNVNYLHWYRVEPDNYKFMEHCGLLSWQLGVDKFGDMNYYGHLFFICEKKFIFYSEKQRFFFCQKSQHVFKIKLTLQDSKKYVLITWCLLNYVQYTVHTETTFQMLCCMMGRCR